ncbi:hypothetical protein [Streptomyces alboflavus]|uniref:hypothetical protein n=1 Tax=Streptomyces alboflavus TaxID=67267 RepID=UPI000F657EE8|nr:hypothetical protein [Streptomyces alboflavus]
MSYPERPTALEVHHPLPITSAEPYAAPLAPMQPDIEREPVVWVPDAYGRMVPMPKHLAPPPVLATEPRDLSPLPLLDPVAQRLIGGGIGGGVLCAGLGYGAGQAIGAAAGFTSGAGLWILLLLLLLLRAPAARAVSDGGSTVKIRKAVIKRSHFYG